MYICLNQKCAVELNSVEKENGLSFSVQGPGRERERERETVCCCDYWPATPALGIYKSGSVSMVSVLLKLSQ